jgi:hypothetical protein
MRLFSLQKSGKNAGSPVRVIFFADARREIARLVS